MKGKITVLKIDMTRLYIQDVKLDIQDSQRREEKPVCDLCKNFLSVKYILIQCPILNDSFEKVSPGRIFSIDQIMMLSMLP